MKRVELSLTPEAEESLALMAKVLTGEESLVHDPRQGCSYRLVQFEDNRVAIQVTDDGPTPTSGPIPMRGIAFTLPWVMNPKEADK